MSGIARILNIALVSSNCRKQSMYKYMLQNIEEENKIVLMIPLIPSKPNTAYAERNIVETAPFGEGSVMVWGCVSYDCILDLITVRGNLNGQIYRPNIHLKFEPAVFFLLLYDR
jgi:hypothetical protein